MKISLDNPTIERNDKVFIKTYPSADIFEGKGAKIEFEEDDDLQLALFRFEGKLRCFGNICPHRHAREIFNGIIDNKRKTLSCPLHGWEYKLENGENADPTRGVKSLPYFETFEENGFAYVEKPDVRKLIPKWRRSDDE